MERMDSLTGPTSPQVVLDGQPVGLPDWLGQSFDAIKTYIECIAMKDERVLWALNVDGLNVDLAQSDPLVNSFRHIHGQTISYNELADRLLSAGRSKVRELLRELEPAVLNVLITDEIVVEEAWCDWEPQFREPLFSLRALNELKQHDGSSEVDPVVLNCHLDQLTFTICEVESLFAHRDRQDGSVDLVSFSEILDFTLIPWLKSLDEIFCKLHEKTRAK